MQARSNMGISPFANRTVSLIHLHKTYLCMEFDIHNYTKRQILNQS